MLDFERISAIRAIADDVEMANAAEHHCIAFTDEATYSKKIALLEMYRDQKKSPYAQRAMKMASGINLSFDRRTIAEVNEELKRRRGKRRAMTAHKFAIQNARDDARAMAQDQF